MKVLHQIGDRKLGGNFNSLEEILSCEDTLSFDGIYTSVYDHYKALKGKDITFYFSGKYLGGDNSFDVGQPLSRFCTWEQIVEMAEYLNAKIGYHGWAHLRCPGLEHNQIVEEIAPPQFYIDWRASQVIKGKHHPLIFAWPYGDVDARCADIARSWGYELAWSVFTKGDDTHRYKLNRTFLNWGHNG